MRPLDLYPKLLAAAVDEALEEVAPTGLREPPYPEFYGDPNGFIRHVLGQEPWTADEALADGRTGKTGQDEWNDALVKHQLVSIVACNGSGKTLDAAWLIPWFMCTRKYPRVVSIAPEWAQVADLLWRYTRAAYSAAVRPLPEPEPLQTKWDLGPQWSAKGFSTDREVRAQGIHAFTDPHTGEDCELLVIVDEAGGIPRWFYDAMLGWLTRGKCYVLMIGNANEADGPFYDSHGPDSLWHSIHVSAFDCPKRIVTDQWIADRRIDPGEGTPMWQIRVEGEFTEAGGQYEWFPQWLRRKAQEVVPPVTDDEGVEEFHMGVDISDTGRDRCVASLLHGFRLVAVEAWNTDELMESVENIIALAQHWRIPIEDSHHIHIDGIGVGSGVVSRLQQLGWDVENVQFGGALMYDFPEYVNEQTKLKNRKAELHHVARRLMIDGRLGIPARFALTHRQLGWLRWKQVPQSDWIICESKETLKKRVKGASPDYADSLLYALSRSSGRITIDSL